MSEVKFNEATGEAEAPTPVATTAATVPVVHGGQVVSVAGGDLQQAIEAGARVATPDEIARQRALNESEKSAFTRAREHGHGVGSAALAQAFAPTQQLSAWTQGGLEGGTAGLGQAGIAGALGAMDPKWRQAYIGEQERLKEAFPMTHTAGVIGGNIARDVTLGALGAAPGALVEGATTRALGSLATRGAIGRALTTGAGMAAGAGVEGALYGSANELSEEMLGDHELAAEKILLAGGKTGLLSALFGGALGVGGSLAASGVRGLAHRVTEGAGISAGLREQANVQRVRALNPTRSQMKELEKRVAGGQGTAGEVLGRYGVTGKGLGEAAVEGDVESVLAKVQVAKQEVGSKLGEIHAASPAITSREAIDSAVEKVIAPLRKAHEHEELVGSLEKYKGQLNASLSEHGPGVDVPIQNLIERRKVLDDIIYREGTPLNPSPRVEHLRKIRGSLEGLIEDSIGEAADRVGDEAGKAALKGLKKDYQVLSWAEKAAEASKAGMQSNRSFGPTDYAAGIIGGAIGGLPGAAIGSAVNKFGRSRGNAVLAAALDKVADLSLIRGQIGKADKMMTAAAKGLTRDAAEQPARLLAAPAKKEAQSLQVKYAAAVKHAGEVQADSARTAAMLAEEPLPHAPKVSGALAMAMARTASSLASRVPPNMAQQILGTAPQAPRATAQDQQRFLEQYGAHVDPEAVLDRLARGVVRPSEVHALRDLSPKAFAELQVKILDEATKPGKRLSSDQRIKLGIAFGIQTDPALEPARLKRLQSAWAMPTGEQGGGAPKGGPAKLGTAEHTGFDAIEARK